MHARCVKWRPWAAIAVLLTGTIIGCAAPSDHDLLPDASAPREPWTGPGDPPRPCWPNERARSDAHRSQAYTSALCVVPDGSPRNESWRITLHGDAASINGMRVSLRSADMEPFGGDPWDHQFSEPGRNLNQTFNIKRTLVGHGDVYANLTRSPLNYHKRWQVELRYLSSENVFEFLVWPGSGAKNSRLERYLLP